jgi:hypothetical protein
MLAALQRLAVANRQITAVCLLPDKPASTAHADGTFFLFRRMFERVVGQLPIDLLP